MTPTPMLDADFVVGRRSFDVVARLCLAPGERLSLFGPSGSGKTTCLEAIAGSVALKRGRIWLDGRLVNAAHVRWARAPEGRPVEPRERRVALVRQPTTLFPHLSVGANVTYHVGGRGLVGGVSVERLLEEVGLGGLAGAAPDSLSGGQRQRACLARAIARPFRALLLDEPFAAVDAASRALLRSIASDASEHAGAAAILVTHDLGEAQAFGHRLGIIDEGSLLQIASTEVLVRQPATKRVAELCGYKSFVPHDSGQLWALHPDRFVEGAWPDRGIVFGGTVRSVQAFGPRYSCEIVLLAGEDGIAAGQSAVQVHAESPPRVGDRWEVTALDPPLVTTSSINDKEGGSNVEDPQPDRGPVETCPVGTGVLPD